MNNKLFGANELSTINIERLETIKQYALYEYQKYMNTSTVFPQNFKEVIKKTSLHKKRNYCINIANNKINIQTLEKYLTYKAGTKVFPLNSDVEKNFFICSGLFPNDEKFLNMLKQYNYLTIFDEFIKNYILLDEKYKDNEKRANMHKSLKYINFIKSYKNELIEIKEYLSYFHCITDINLVINKLLQICYLNPELYNSYVKTNEEKKLTKK